MKTDFKFEKKLDLNHVLTACSLLIPAGVLYYQAQATSIARRDLNSKLNDIAKVAADLTHESAARQQSEFDQLTKSVASLQGANELAKAQSDASTAETRNAALSEIMFAKCLQVSAILLRPNHLADEQKNSLADAVAEIQDSIIKQSKFVLANTDARGAAGKRCELALQEVSSGKLPQPERDNKVRDALATLKADIQLANHLFEQQLKEPREQRTRAIAVIERIISNFAR